MKASILPKIRDGKKTVEIIKDGKSFLFKGKKAKRLIDFMQEDEQGGLNLFIKYLK